MQTLTLQEEGACVGTEMSGEQSLPICRTGNLNPRCLTSRRSQPPLALSVLLSRVHAASRRWLRMSCRQRRRRRNSRPRGAIPNRRARFALKNSSPRAATQAGRGSARWPVGKWDASWQRIRRSRTLDARPDESGRRVRSASRSADTKACQHAQ